MGVRPVARLARKLLVLTPSFFARKNTENVEENTQENVAIQNHENLGLLAQKCTKLTPISLKTRVRDRKFSDEE